MTDDEQTMGFTRTVRMVGGPIDALAVGSIAPVQRTDGITLNAEVVSIERIDATTVDAVLWHDLPFDVDTVEREYTHADGRACLWSPEKVGQPVWAYAVSDTEGAPCRRDHWMVLVP